MLLELKIQNLALIENLRVPFQEGLNVLSGETGAGKSIVIDALNLVLGEHVGSEVIKSGKEKCEVEGIFKAPESRVFQSMLQEADIAQDDHLILYREFSAPKGSLCRVNGRAVPLHFLKKLSLTLADIHGQHEHQSLLHPENHILFLDGFGAGKLTKPLTGLHNLFNRMQEIKTELAALRRDERDMLRETDMAQFQMDEINRAGLKEGEDEELESLILRMSHSEKLKTAAEESFELLSGEQKGISALEHTAKALNILQKAASLDNRLSPLCETLAQAQACLEDVSDELTRYKESIEFDPRTLDQAHERLELIKSLKRKYGSGISEIHAFARNAAEKIKNYSSREEKIAEHEKQLLSLQNDFCREGSAVHKIRKEHAGKLEKTVELELKKLDMEHTQFKIHFSFEEAQDGLPFQGKNARAHEKGFDMVEFLISPNPGEPLKPLAKIVSGGELSRTMLALKSVLAKTDGISTMVFDEIDAGIGGRAAEKIGRKLLDVARDRQVICVTHLPTIASFADQHLCVEKTVENRKTNVAVHVLNSQDKVKEIARMLRGSGVTETTLKDAKELLEKGQECRNRK